MTENRPQYSPHPGRRYEAPDSHVYRVKVEPNSQGGAFGNVDPRDLPPLELCAWVRFEREGNATHYGRAKKPLDRRYEDDLTDAELEFYFNEALGQG